MIYTIETQDFPLNNEEKIAEMSKRLVSQSVSQWKVFFGTLLIIHETYVFFFWNVVTISLLILQIHI